MKINIILPFFKKEPGGGLKVMYQYANQLHENGHDVVVYHASFTRWTHRKQRFFHYLLVLAKWYRDKMPSRRPSWFNLHEDITSLEVPKVKNRYIRDADVIFSTWWATTLETDELSQAKGRKHNLVQGNEIFLTKWPDLVRESYRRKANHIVISRHLQSVVAAESMKTPHIIPNAIDHAQFFRSSPIQSRDKLSIILLYSPEAVKGLKYSIPALERVYKEYPAIKVTFFCAKNTPPNNLPFQFDFYHNPSDLNKLYNNAAIFVSGSLHEGWGLPAMEAMACGCACVCTAIDGYLDFMTDNINALLVPASNTKALSQSIVRLIEDDQLRYRIAEEAHKSVKDFNWARSTQLLEKEFLTYNVNE